MDLCCSIEALDWCFRLVICEIVRDSVLTLGIVLETVLLCLCAWHQSCHSPGSLGYVYTFWRNVQFSHNRNIPVLMLCNHSCVCEAFPTEFTSSLSTVSVVLSSGLGTSYPASRVEPAALVGPSAPEDVPASLLEILGQFVNRVLSVQSGHSGCRAWNLSAYGILCLTNFDALIQGEAGSLANTLLVCLGAIENCHDGVLV